MPKIKELSIYTLLLFFYSCSWGGTFKQGTPINKKSAIQIAEENFINKYGPEVLKQKPFQAELKNEVWFVSGTFHCPQGTGCKGGTAEIEISAKDGKVIKITHGK